jgi:hypothetical protein
MDVLRSARLDLRLGEETSFAGSEQRAWYPLRFDRRAHPYADVRCRGVTAAAVMTHGAGITIVDRTLAEGISSSSNPSDVGCIDATGASVETPTVTTRHRRSQAYDHVHRGAVVDHRQPTPRSRTDASILGYNDPRIRRLDARLPNSRWAFVRPTAEATAGG